MILDILVRISLCNIAISINHLHAFSWKLDDVYSDFVVHSDFQYSGHEEDL